ncbi:long-chain fatty acid--CoA ligase [Actinomycetospora sp. TBRC 11914]|uniref:AMP-dependent synthetase/ligase n=1 Tax=Actinomycetospora sp. TBRC 11914 TaxID=2729387 RepID=UPI00145DE4FE|nr:long-chain fatty acid--CoA ligase [Actinomycetospora sp. TBRC 11914]NMO91647.1 long-chain fatty acid--CoA ligase [Actinomycetospora sp. TBRC 11914]
MTATTSQPSLVTDDVVGRGTLCATFRHQVTRIPDRVALRTLTGAPEITWEQFGSRVDRVAAGLASLGLRDGDRLALMTTNSPEFFLVDMAALHLGVVPTSIYNSLPPEDVAFILRDAEVRVVVAEPAFLDVVLAARAQAPGVETVVVIDDAAGAADTTLADVETAPGPSPEEIDDIRRAIGPEHVATISYTSGTTGDPKGVVLTHRAILSCLDALDQVTGTLEGARVVAFLPFAHMGGRIFAYYPVVAYGFTVSCCADITDVPRYLLDTRPNYLCSPPRLFEKMRGAIEARIARNEGGWGERASAALDVGYRLIDQREAGAPQDPDLLARWERERDEVLTPLLATVGLDQVEASLFGSAAVPPHLVRFYLALGLPVLEAWGMTEVVAFGSINRPDDVRVGTVGFPFPGNEIRLAEDGEILIRSPWVMERYLNRPELTAQTLVDGWLHSGDIGEYDDEGRLSVVDRKKELIISAYGKNMSPANIEFKLKAAGPVIGQACVIGDGRKFNTALIVIDPEVAAGVAGRAAAPEELAADPEVVAAVDRAVTDANAAMARVETIKRYRVLDVVWQPSGDELSPTMKLRRKPIAAKYADLIEEMYAEDDR